MPLFAGKLLRLGLFGNPLNLKTDRAGFGDPESYAGGRKFRVNTVWTEVARPFIW